MRHASGGAPSGSRAAVRPSSVDVAQQVTCTANVPVASMSGPGLLNHSGGVVPPALLEESRVPRFYQQAIASCGATSGAQLPNTALVYNMMVTSQLPRNVLAHIWSLVNRTLPGQLTRQEFFSCLALIALAQRGQSLSALSAVSVLPIPHLQACVPYSPQGATTASSTSQQQVSFVQPSGTLSFAAATRAHPVQSAFAPSTSRLPAPIAPTDLRSVASAPRRPAVSQIPFPSPIGTPSVSQTPSPSAVAAPTLPVSHRSATPVVSQVPSSLTVATPLSSTAAANSNQVWQNTASLFSTGAQPARTNISQKSSAAFLPRTLKIDPNRQMTPLAEFGNFAASLPSTPNASSGSPSNLVPSTVSQLGLLGGTAVSTKGRTSNMPSSFSANFPLNAPSSANTVAGSKKNPSFSQPLAATKRPSGSVKSIDLLSEISFPSAFDASRPSTSAASQGSAAAAVSNGYSHRSAAGPSVPDQFGDFASSARAAAAHLDANVAQQSDIQPQPPVTQSAAEPSNSDSTDIYAAVKAIEGNLEDEQAGSERRRVWKRCIAEAHELFRSADVVLPPFSRDAIAEVARTEKGAHYLTALGAVHAMVRRISEGRSDKLKEEESRLRDIFAVWSRLKEFADASSLDESEQRTTANGLRVARCSICLVDIPDGALLEFAANAYHKQCANFWINRVESLLPTLS